METLTIERPKTETGETPVQLKKGTGETPGQLAELFDVGIAQEIDRYLEQSGLSEKQFAKNLGTSPAYLNNYRNKGAEFAYFADVQRRAREWFRDQALHVGERVTAPAGFIATTPSVATQKALEKIAATRDCGIIYGPGGVGKTMGVLDYHAAHSNLLLFTAGNWTGFRESWALQRWLIATLNLRRREGRNPNMIDVFDKLKDSGRQLVIDDAHLLYNSALDFLAFFYERTGISVAVVGNETLPARIDNRPDQVWRRYGQRIGIVARYLPTPDSKTVSDGYRPGEVRAIVERYVPAPSAALLKLAGAVARNRGLLGRLDKVMQFVPKQISRGSDDVAALQKILRRFGQADLAT